MAQHEWEFLKFQEVLDEEHISATTLTTPLRNDAPMNTMLMQELAAGDVIEVKTAANVDDDVMTVLVLLATDEFVILDPCNDSTPFVLKNSELIEYRKFDPTLADT